MSSPLRFLLRNSSSFYSSVRWLSRSNERSVYDLVIVGGGIVGLALAASVGQTSSMDNARVLLLESSTSPPIIKSTPQLFSNRVCSLSLGTVKFLESFGIWSDAIDRAKPFKRIYVWDACSPAAITFSSDDLTESQFNVSSEQFGGDSYDSLMTSNDIMGYIVENSVLLGALSNKVEDCNIEIRRGVTLETLNYVHSEEDVPNPFLSLTLDNGTDIVTKLLVGADGTKSHVRQLAGFQDPIDWNYNQSAVVATLCLQQGLMENTIAWQRFLPDGPIALLPLSDNCSSLVWSTTPAHAKQLMEMTPEEFVLAINTALFEEFPQDPIVTSTNMILRNYLSLVTPNAVPVKQLPPTVAEVQEDSRGIFPLTFSHSLHYVKPRVALIGDAAHRVHPLAGLGVNLGFGDVMSLHQELLHNSTIGGDWGSFTSLLSYEKQSQRLNVPIMATIDGLQRLFSTTVIPLVALRSLGLQLIGAIQPIKDFIVSHAQRKH